MFDVNVSYNDIHDDNYQTLSPNRMVSVYLMASYLYYIENISPMLDYEYDFICKTLLDNYEKVTHPHKHLIDISSLKAGTAFNIKDNDYPNIVKGAAKTWLRVIYDRTGIGHENRKKSQKTKLKTVRIIGDAKEDIDKSLKNMGVDNVFVTSLEPILNESYIAVVEY